MRQDVCKRYFAGFKTKIVKDEQVEIGRGEAFGLGLGEAVQRNVLNVSGV